MAHQNMLPLRVRVGTRTLSGTSPDMGNQKKMSSLIPKNKPSPTRRLLSSLNIVHTHASGGARILVQVMTLNQHYPWKLKGKTSTSGVGQYVSLAKKLLRKLRQRLKVH